MKAKAKTQHDVVTAFLDGTSKEDRDRIAAIARRAVKGAGEHGRNLDTMEVNMDLMCVHHFHGIDLPKLAAFDDFNFFHDIFGIDKHLDRDTGELLACFRPRCLLHGIEPMDDGALEAMREAMHEAAERDFYDEGFGADAEEC